MAGNAQAQMRRRIAEGAARLMLENGIHDYAQAKRKAARQLGAPDSHSLPSNDEIKAALAEYRNLFGDEDRAATVHALQQQALEVMRSLARFSPQLTGALASGQPQNTLELEIPDETGKAFEQFLASEGIEYRNADRGRLPCFLLYSEPADVRVCIVSPGAGSHASLSLAQLERVVGE